MVIELAPKPAISKSESSGSSDDDSYDNELVNNRFHIRKKMIDKFMKECSSEKGMIHGYILLIIYILIHEVLIYRF
jgi:hypothetical protein